MKKMMDYIKFFHIEEPEAGRFVAFYSDGSGAKLFLKCDNGLIDVDGEEYGEYYDFQDSFSTWIQLPDDFEFWFELERDEVDA